MLPFVFAPMPGPTNGADIPDSLPFTLGLDSTSGALVQEPNERVDAALSKAYPRGSNITGMMEETGIGKQYADDFLAFLQYSLGKERFEGLKVLEIGCGTGYFLHRLKMLGADVLGIEPGAQGQDGSARYRVPIVRDFFPSKQMHDTFDIIILYGVLEHIQQPSDFLRHLPAQLRTDGRIMFSVPDCEPYIRAGDISMLLHEHWNYFTEVTFSNVIRSSIGREVKCENAGFGAAVYAMALDYESYDQEKRSEERTLQEYRSLAERGLTRLRGYLDEATANRESVGVYVPARIINGLSIIRTESPLSEIRFFDDNRWFEGRYFPGFNIQIEPGENLLTNPTDRVLIMSHAFGNRIAKRLSPLEEKGVTLTGWDDLFPG